MQAAYGDADLVAEMFDSIDTDIKAIGEALKAVAGSGPTCATRPGSGRSPGTPTSPGTLSLRCG